MITVYNYAILKQFLTTNRTDSLQYTAIIAAYKAYPPYGARTQYLSLSSPAVIQRATRPPNDGGELCRRCVSRWRIEVAEMKVGKMCALNSTVTHGSREAFPVLTVAQCHRTLEGRQYQMQLSEVFDKASYISCNV